MKTYKFEFTLFIPALIALFIWARWFAPYDDTDAPGERSGLTLYIDHKTGCQYLKAGSLFSGALTPRLGNDGKHICVTPAAANQQGEKT